MYRVLLVEDEEIIRKGIRYSVGGVRLLGGGRGREWGSR